MKQHANDLAELHSRRSGILSRPTNPAFPLTGFPSIHTHIPTLSRISRFTIHARRDGLIAADDALASITHSCITPFTRGYKR